MSLTLLFDWCLIRDILPVYFQSLSSYKSWQFWSLPSLAVDHLPGSELQVNTLKCEWPISEYDVYLFLLSIINLSDWPLPQLLEYLKTNFLKLFINWCLADLIKINKHIPKSKTTRQYIILKKMLNNPVIRLCISCCWAGRWEKVKVFLF